jgi:hypothetical protein
MEFTSDFTYMLYIARVEDNAYHENEVILGKLEK